MLANRWFEFAIVVDVDVVDGNVVAVLIQAPWLFKFNEIVEISKLLLLLFGTMLIDGEDETIIVVDDDGDGNDVFDDDDDDDDSGVIVIHNERKNPCIHTHTKQKTMKITMVFSCFKD